MPIVVVHQGPTVTKDSYTEAVRRITGGKDRMESLSDWPVDGVIFHTAGQSASGFRIVDVWESEDAFRRFGESLGPVLAEVGITDEPEIYEPTTFVARRRSESETGPSPPG